MFSFLRTNLSDERRCSLGRLLFWTLLGTSSCGGGTPVVRTGIAPGPTEGIAVTSLPPPAHIEVLPIRRNAHCRWQDGHYRPRSTLNQGSATEWVWTPGAWVDVPPNCRYQPPRTEAERRKEGARIAFFPPSYFDPETKEPCSPPSVCD